ncbi:MAG: hypothetical protein ABI886_18380 [Betaproteobacteria bacterium]
MWAPVKVELRTTMILSHQHRFVFIKGMKVASTSVELAFSRICGPDDVITPVSPIDEKLRIDAGDLPRNFAAERAIEVEYVRQIRELPLDRLLEAEVPWAQLRFYNHMPLAEVEQRADRPLDAYTIVGVERDPYEKVVSLANWMLQAPYYSRGQAIRFDAGQMRAAVDLLIRDRTILMGRNIERYRRLDGRLELTTMRYETLADDFGRLMQQLGVPTPWPALPHAKKGNYTARPVDVLSPRQVAIVNELFAEEFSYFGYPKR